MDSSKTDVSRDEGSAAVGGRGGKSSVLARKRLVFKSLCCNLQEKLDYMYCKSGVYLYLYLIYI